MSEKKSIILTPLSSKSSKQLALAKIRAMLRPPQTKDFEDAIYCEECKKWKEAKEFHAVYQKNRNFTAKCIKCKRKEHKKRLRRNIDQGWPFNTLK